MGSKRRSVVKGISHAEWDASRSNAPEDCRLSPTARSRALQDTRRGVRVVFAPKEITDWLESADRVLNGNSNDAEHDILYGLHQWLNEVLEDPGRRIPGSYWQQQRRTGR